ncbi:hypothetical protein F2Q69_00020344 [Brassica cretica]|uniref:Uncharacterized protein n=1 Tax=Brassica cretica TaxID=69181 RepID=A0A8S9QN50_BRACR|nr:hypothetical protein F2Q69_00020344 [Brassica cretica]
MILYDCHCFLKLVPLSRSWSRKWWARFSLVDHQGRVSHVDVTAPASLIEDQGMAIPIEDRDRVALGKDDRIAWCWTSWSKFCDSDQIVPNPSRSTSGPWCWVGRLGIKVKPQGEQHHDSGNPTWILEPSHCFLKLVPLSRSWSGKWWARFSLVDHQGRVSHVDVTAPGESDRGLGHGDSDCRP